MMKTDTHITNTLQTAQPGHDGWMHVCPLGEFPWTSADGQETIIQVIDQAAAELMCKSYPLSDLDALIDREHESMSADGATLAMGWGKEAGNRSDGVWVRSDWSDTGRKAVEGKEFRFNSPCFPRDGLVPLGGNRYRVTKLGRIALTNNPNLRGQKPLTNSRPAANPKPNTPPSKMDIKTILLSLLGLPADASDDQIQAAAAEMKAKPKPETLNSRIQELETQLANTDLDAAGITDPAQRALFAPMLCNAEKRPAALAALGVMKGKAAIPSTLHNKKDAKHPTTDQQLSGSELQNAEAEKAKGAWIGNRARELKAQTPHRPHRDCFSQAESEYVKK